jgi:hypothetical protein
MNEGRTTAGSRGVGRSNGDGGEARSQRREVVRVQTGGRQGKDRRPRRQPASGQTNQTAYRSVRFVARAIPHIISPFALGPGTKLLPFAHTSNLPQPDEPCYLSPRAHHSPLIDRPAPRAVLGPNTPNQHGSRLSTAALCPVSTRRAARRECVDHVSTVQRAHNSPAAFAVARSRHEWLRQS